jgi:hypothetical protein
MNIRTLQGRVLVCKADDQASESGVIGRRPQRGVGGWVQ